MLLLLRGPVGWAQTLTLDECYALAKANYPLVRQKALNDQQAANAVARLNHQRLLPQLAVNGQATYQSEVTTLPIELPGVEIPTLSKDQYRLTLDATQTLFDAGATRRQQEWEQQKYRTENQRVEVELYRLRSHINQLYFGVLLSDENIRLREALQADLQQRREALVALQRNGAATLQDLDKLDAELLNLDQQLKELALNRGAMLTQLSELVGQSLEEVTRLETPTAPTQGSGSRPELGLYAQQRTQLEVQRQLLDTQLAPRLSLFGQAGYGRPTLNFLRNDFHGYYQVGARLNWNLSNFYYRRRDLEGLRLQQESVRVQEEVFQKNQRLELVQQQAQIDRYQTLLETDSALVVLRQRVRETADVQLKNGIIRFADYFTEANALTQAQLQQQLHRLQLLQAQIESQTIAGATAAVPE